MYSKQYFIPDRIYDIVWSTFQSRVESLCYSVFIRIVFNEVIEINKEVIQCNSLVNRYSCIMRTLSDNSYNRRHIICSSLLIHNNYLSLLWLTIIESTNKLPMGLINKDLSILVPEIKHFFFSLFSGLWALEPRLLATLNVRGFNQYCHGFLTISDLLYGTSWEFAMKCHF